MAGIIIIGPAMRRVGKGDSGHLERHVDEHVDQPKGVGRQGGEERTEGVTSHESRARRRNEEVKTNVSEEEHE